MWQRGREVRLRADERLGEWTDPAQPWAALAGGAKSLIADGRVRAGSIDDTANLTGKLLRQRRDVDEDRPPIPGTPAGRVAP